MQQLSLVGIFKHSLEVTLPTPPPPQFENHCMSPLKEMICLSPFHWAVAKLRRLSQVKSHSFFPRTSILHQGVCQDSGGTVGLNCGSEEVTPATQNYNFSQFLCFCQTLLSSSSPSSSMFPQLRAQTTFWQLVHRAQSSRILRSGVRFLSGGSAVKRGVLG